MRRFENDCACHFERSEKSAEGKQLNAEDAAKFSMAGCIATLLHSIS